MIEDVTAGSIPIRLSVVDQNMIALMWMGEIILRAIVEDARKLEANAPENKRRLYSHVISVASEAHAGISSINTATEDEAVRCYSEEYASMLVDVTNAIVSMYGSMTLKSIMAVMKAGGVTVDSTETYRKGLGGIIDRSRL